MDSRRGVANAGPALPEPAVAAGEYDERYYLEGCAGADVWRESAGAHAAGLYWGSVERARVTPGDTVVDLGTGRGEALVVACEMGAARAIGVDYAPAALRLAARTLDAHGVRDRCLALRADARRLPLPGGCADLVLMLDIVEHLTPAELDATLSEAVRILRPGGRVFVHTLPSRTLYEVTYRLQRSLPWNRGWPADPRNDDERRMHVNEQTVGSLRASLRRAGFAQVEVRVGKWIHDGFVPSARARRTYHRLAAFPPTARFGAADIWAQACRPAQPGRTTSRPASSMR
ncbi:MAG TPA: methyltransferase domain-containing protein [Candidatus Dormibacteraeota bacterium]|nr:methyltransferase domain-containing protein [Candidatus Dormibacteraeota bacterium]